MSGGGPTRFLFFGADYGLGRRVAIGRVNWLQRGGGKK